MVTKENDFENVLSDQNANNPTITNTTATTTTSTATKLHKNNFMYNINKDNSNT